MKLPNNMIMVYSNPIIDKIVKVPPKHFHKVFNVVRDADVKVNCAGKCINCLKCYKKNEENCIIEKLK